MGDDHSGTKVVAGTETVNSYAALTADAAAGATSLAISKVVGDPSGFAAGDLVLVWRATGVDASDAPSGHTTRRLELSTARATTSSGIVHGLVGTYELARVQSADAAAGTVTLTEPLVHAFTKHVSQIVKVPEYVNVTVPAGASIAAAPWQQIDGDPTQPDPDAPWAGGIVIFVASGTIQNDGLIHANARGFHGGLPRQRVVEGTPACDAAAFDGDSETGPYAPKGEGIVHASYRADMGGRGNISMAGGGGSCSEAGGGGGANLGNGGSGSGSARELGAGGLGAVSIDFDSRARLTMGGGGGAGRYLVEPERSQPGFGGFGGGVVYIRGASMSGAGRIEANGGTAADSGLSGLPTDVSPSAPHASGGGGAGGTVVVRLTDDLDCEAISALGGGGGDAKAAGAAFVGAGGGGGGGLIRHQAKTKAAGCKILVGPGQPGNTSDGASAGADGAARTPKGHYCYETTPDEPGACTVAERPFCDLEKGECTGCTGPQHSGTPYACELQFSPVCLKTGECSPCTGHLGSGSPRDCQLAAYPFCKPDPPPTTHVGPSRGAECIKCIEDADCDPTGGQALVCHREAGACGEPGCTKDEDCKANEWCAEERPNQRNVCVPKTPNRQPMSPLDPIEGECTAANGERTCLSGVCEEDDDLCGKRNSRPCDEALECRSEICFDADKFCGKPNREPCEDARECRSDICFDRDDHCGLPVHQPCTEDSQCRSDHCDTDEGRCVECLEDAHCAEKHKCDANLRECVPVEVAGPEEPDPAPEPVDPEDRGGIVEGGGCACNATTPTAASPLALLGAAASAFLFLRRRRDRGVDNSKSPIG